MKNGKVIYVHKGEWPSNSPSIIFVSGTVYGLASNCPTVLIIRNNSEKPTGDIFKNITGKDVPESLTIERIGTEKKKYSASAFFIKSLKLIRDMNKKEKIHAVITRNIGFLPYLYYIKRNYGIPSFFESHDFFGDLGLRTDLKKNLNTLKNNFLERLFVPRLDGLICLSGVQESIFRKKYSGIKTVVANTGIMDVSKTHKPEGKTVCYIGSLDNHKGLGTVLQALSETADKDIGLMIIGGKSEQEKINLLDKANEMGLTGRVEITGWINHSEIGSFMNRCMAGIVPLDDTPFNRYLTSPLKILDYFSRSLPVMASDLPAVREYITDGRQGFLFAPGSADKLAIVLDRFFSGNYYDTMGKEIELSAKMLGWDKRGEKILKFIESH